MEQRDYLIREIEKISVLVLGMLGRLKQRIAGKQFEFEDESMFNEFEEETGLNINQILAANYDDIESLLPKEKGFSYSNIELIAELLVEFSRTVDDGSCQTCLEKAILLLQWVDREGKIFSFERTARIAEIRSLL